jgi:hypothetical protein
MKHASVWPVEAHRPRHRRRPATERARVSMARVRDPSGSRELGFHGTRVHGQRHLRGMTDIELMSAVSRSWRVWTRAIRFVRGVPSCQEHNSAFTQRHVSDAHSGIDVSAMTKARSHYVRASIAVFFWTALGCCGGDGGQASGASGSTMPAAAGARSVAGATAAGAGAPASGGAAGAVAAGSAGKDAAGGTASGMQSAQPGGACCEAQPRAGCATASVEQCVCAQVPSCCRSGWDIVCVQLVDELSCGSCQSDCCHASNNAGCSDASVQACVCKGDPKCCNGPWDAFCTTLVTSLACGTCS